jgi:hypothetical protein
MTAAGFFDGTQFPLSLLVSPQSSSVKFPNNAPGAAAPGYRPKFLGHNPETIT